MLVRIERCGVCHSDLHLQDGYFALGGDKRLDVSAGRKLPFTLGHEIAGVIESVGRTPTRRSSAAALPSIPGLAAAFARPAARGEENLCSAHRHLGIAVDGGYATHVLVPHPRYLLDYAPLSAELCRDADVLGLTAYAALNVIRTGPSAARSCSSVSAASA